MTGLWTNDRDTLAKGVGTCPWQGSTATANYLIDTGVVRVLDPDDAKLVDRVAVKLGITRYIVREVIEALRQP